MYGEAQAGPAKLFDAGRLTRRWHDRPGNSLLQLSREIVFPHACANLS
jgi:hypothetical protein